MAGQVKKGPSKRKPKKSSTKFKDSKAISEFVHAGKRLVERYNIVYTWELRNRLIKYIRDNTNILLKEKQSLRVNRYIITSKNVVYDLIYDKKRKEIVTFLPMGEEYKNIDEMKMYFRGGKGVENPVDIEGNVISEGTVLTTDYGDYETYMQKPCPEEYKVKPFYLVKKNETDNFYFAESIELFPSMLDPNGRFYLHDFRFKYCKVIK